MTESKQVLCVGGALHGQLTPWNGRDQFYAVSHLPFGPPRQSYSKPPRQYDSKLTLAEETELLHARDTYQLQTYRTRCGGGFRETQVMLVEGRPLFPDEQWALEDHLETIMWRPYDPPNFIDEFDRWFDWCAYKHTRDFKYIEEYIQW